MTKPIKARGREKELLKIIVDLQDMIGAAKGQHDNDRDQTAFERAQKILEEAFNLCVKTGSYYEYDEDIWAGEK